jgi:hypothetical protein
MMGAVKAVTRDKKSRDELSPATFGKSLDQGSRQEASLKLSTVFTGV